MVDFFKFLQTLNAKSRSPVLLATVVLFGSIFYFFPKEAGASTWSHEFVFPSYLQQLEGYKLKVAQDKADEERVKRENVFNNVVIQHAVQPGETLSAIAREYNTDITSLVYWNRLGNPHLIYEGQILYILTVEGMLHHVQEGDTVGSIASRYRVKPGTIMTYNLLSSSNLSPGKKLIIPGGTLPEEDKDIVMVALASRQGVRKSVQETKAPAPFFQWPLKGKITSHYGWRNGMFHYGLDIAASHGKEIKAAAAGRVSYLGCQRGYGLMLIIDHGEGWSTLYAHNSAILAANGGLVFSGQPVAKIGDTGNATGPHLHFEIIWNDHKLNPLRFLP